MDSLFNQGAAIVFSLGNLITVPNVAHVFVERIPSKVERTCNLEGRCWVNQVQSIIRSYKYL